MRYMVKLDSCQVLIRRLRSSAAFNLEEDECSGVHTDDDTHCQLDLSTRTNGIKHAMISLRKMFIPQSFKVYSKRYKKTIFLDKHFELLLLQLLLLYLTLVCLLKLIKSFCGTNTKLSSYYQT